MCFHYAILCYVLFNLGLSNHVPVYYITLPCIFLYCVCIYIYHIYTCVCDVVVPYWFYSSMLYAVVFYCIFMSCVTLHHGFLLYYSILQVFLFSQCIKQIYHCIRVHPSIYCCIISSCIFKDHTVLFLRCIVAYHGALYTVTSQQVMLFAISKNYIVFACVDLVYNITSQYNIL